MNMNKSLEQLATAGLVTASGVNVEQFNPVTRSQEAARKVLIIEDDSVVASVYRSRLVEDGFQVEVAKDGQAGFYRIHETRPDVILLDWMLPKIAGSEILRKIRAQKQFQDTPVIVYTSAFLPDVIESATDVGSTQFFNKAQSTPLQIIEALRSALVPVKVPASSALPLAEEKTAVGTPVLPPGNGDAEFRAGVLRGFFENAPSVVSTFAQFGS